MTTLELWQIAKRAWKDSEFKYCTARRKCVRCFNEWVKNGRNIEEKPPLFPLDYEEKCPACGEELSPPFVPF